LLGKTSVTLPEAIKRDFRDLGGTRNMRLIHWKEEEDLLGWEDPGEAPQHRMKGYMPMVDEETVPQWINPRKQKLETLRERGRGKNDVPVIHTAHVFFNDQVMINKARPITIFGNMAEIQVLQQ
jgi:hypothetical protein